MTKGLIKFYGSTGPENFIFWYQTSGRSRIYQSLKIQVSIQDIGSNAYFSGAEGRKDYLDVKKSQLVTILRVITIKKLFCHRKESKVTGGPVPYIPVPYFHKYWPVPNE